MENKVLLDSELLNITINRLCYQLIENHHSFDYTVIIGVQPRGIYLSQRIHERLIEITQNKNIHHGILDITFYRDDFRTSNKPLAANVNDMPFIITNKKVILVDDVSYTGRSVQAALSALNHYGRPESIKLLVLVDRHFNRQLPIQPDYIGVSVEALDEAYVRVDWATEEKNTDKILFFPQKQ